MWCWHRIRESESGLCPACRTPYGEDPHQFTIVDVEVVLKANKEKNSNSSTTTNNNNISSNNNNNSSSTTTNNNNSNNNYNGNQQISGSNSTASGAGGVSTNTGATGGNNTTSTTKKKDDDEIPKDRSQLANMRVIRRNLVYCVGLPSTIASEDALRRPEYFGQYGKIHKIVLNRAVAGDARRASASAYVTFCHKEDTLACILALDGFNLENRNIRASYGTSKYCSAFIKSVRCNNPECTYLHEMGAPEDTFTKQEIQAGYVTSGRDVLQRQQQIVSELQRHLQPRKKVGGGGPSGTGKPSANPIFPPPEYDFKPIATPAPTQAIARATTTTVLPSSSGSVGSSHSGSMVAQAPLGRSQSVGANHSPILASMTSASTGGAGIAQTHQRNLSAAAVVAGSHAGVTPAAGATKPPPEDLSHSTLTPLTPLKRATKKPPEPVSTLTQSEPIGGAVIGNGVFNSDGGLSELGGEVFTGQLPSSNKSAIGSQKWNESNGQLIHDNAMGEIGGSPLPGLYGLNLNSNNNSTTALASILGIHLPTGSGSLRDWPQGPSPLSSLNQSAQGGSSLIGGVPIGGVPIGSVPFQTTPAMSSLCSSNSSGSSSGLNSNSNSFVSANAATGKNDIALLQSLLPGVHITTGGPAQLGGEPWGGNSRRTTVGAIGRPLEHDTNGSGIW